MNENTHPHQITQRLVRAIRKVASNVAQSEIAESYTLATVDTTSPFTVIIDGSSTAVAAHHIGSYSPTIGDRVWCTTPGRQVFCYGTFV